MTHAPRLRDLDWLATCEVGDRHADGWTDPGARPDDLAVLQFTSGSTGAPKGVMLTHAAILHNVAQMQRVLGLSAETLVVSWLPAFHDMGLIGNLLQAVYSGLSLVYMAPLTLAQDPLLWLQAISTYRAYVSGGPNFAFRHCVERMTREGCAGLDLSGWKVAYVGAEPISDNVLDRFVNVFGRYGFRREALVPCYGLAEASLMVTCADRAEVPIVRRFDREALAANLARPNDAGLPLVSCGRPIRDMVVRVVEPTSAEPLAEGRVGEVWVAGPSLGRGYWNDPEATAQTFQAHSEGDAERVYLRTGDLGFFQGGELFIAGRAKDLIIIRGRNYHPQDVEEAARTACPELAGHAGVACAIETDAGPRLVLLHEAERERAPAVGASSSRASSRPLASCSSWSCTGWSSSGRASCPTRRAARCAGRRRPGNGTTASSGRSKKSRG